MPITLHETRPGAYHDSVVLMQLQKALADLPGVVDAGVVMATPANRDLLASSDLLPPDTAGAKADDLLIVVKAENEGAAREALGQVDGLLKRRRSRESQDFRPRSLASAVGMLPEAAWVLVSVPGRYAAGVAREALAQGKHVFLYSDNVPLDDEVALKEEAQDKGLLVMGPDCGTAIVNGIGLGFANRVRRGTIGLVAASGTGLQAIATNIHRMGGGISQAIGTGGRDLSPEVGGTTALQALDLLARDPETEVIVLVSKPPAPEVATRLLGAARRVEKPVVVYFMGQPATVRQLGNLHFAFNLSDAADLALFADPGLDQSKTSARHSPAYVRGLFSGGTLAYEAMLALQNVVSPLYSNVPLRPSQRLPDVTQSRAHTILDMGEDEFTQGRLHPMMDNDLRIRRLRQEAADPAVSMILLDVVLGEGAHPDPAGALAPVIAEVIAEHDVAVAAIVVGTDEDPQDVDAQTEQLEQAGAMVFAHVDQAVAAVTQFTAPPDLVEQIPVPLDALQKPLAAINVGLESFYDSLRGQGAGAVQVAWRPPAGGNEKLMALLAQMKSTG